VTIKNLYLNRIMGFLAIVAFAPLVLVFGVAAASFLLQEFVNGWIPSNWFSSSGLDWLFAGGTDGGASNYFGFMLTGVPAGLSGGAVLWGVERLRSRPPKDGAK
jgi:hypothetical protein